MGERSCKCQRKMIQPKGNEQKYLTHSFPQNTDDTKHENERLVLVVVRDLNKATLK